MDYSFSPLAFFTASNGGEPRGGAQQAVTRRSVESRDRRERHNDGQDDRARATPAASSCPTCQGRIRRRGHSRVWLSAILTNTRSGAKRETRTPILLHPPPFASLLARPSPRRAGLGQPGWWWRGGPSPSAGGRRLAAGSRGPACGDGGGPARLGFVRRSSPLRLNGDAVRRATNNRWQRQPAAVGRSTCVRLQRLAH